MKLPRFTFLQWAVHIGSWIPLAVIVYDYFQGKLTANPIQDITYRTGKTALLLLVLSLAVTPANTLFGYKPLIRVRRALGLYAFMYVALHFLVFVGLDYGFDLGLLKDALFEKKYALVGLASGLILLPLAITSTRVWMARLGRKWKRLHNLVFLAGVLAVIHYIWSVKLDIRTPLDYGLAVVLLLIARLPLLRKNVSNLRIQMMGRMRKLRSKVLIQQPVAHRTP